MDYCSPGSSVHGHSPGKNNGVSCYTLLQRIFPSQGLNPGLLHCRRILDDLSHQGRPRILVWLAYPFSSGSSWPRNWTRASCIASGFFTIWATREALCNFCPYNSGHFVHELFRWLLGRLEKKHTGIHRTGHRHRIIKKKKKKKTLVGIHTITLC